MHGSVLLSSSSEIFMVQNFAKYCEFANIINWLLCGTATLWWHVEGILQYLCYSKYSYLHSVTVQYLLHTALWYLPNVQISWSQYLLSDFNFFLFLFEQNTIFIYTVKVGNTLQNSRDLWYELYITLHCKSSM